MHSAPLEKPSLDGEEKLVYYNDGIIRGKSKQQAAGSDPFLLNSNDHSTPVSFTAQANSTGRAEGQIEERRRPLPRPVDHFRSSWIPASLPL